MAAQVQTHKYNQIKRKRNIIMFATKKKNQMKNEYRNKYI